MGRIEKLSETVINRIAAGEVVERPVAVVRELVENALDAGAKRVEVEFRDGGKSLIRITDNGCGMTKNDALLALQRHATSKIRTVEDIMQIGSFGFRGEALPSIASVSRFVMRTRPEEQDSGTEITVDGGSEPRVRECGMPHGTFIEVSQLFHTVPVRRKFLKTDRTESGHILHACRLFAIAHPGVAFTVIEDGKTVFQSPPCPSLKERIQEIFGRSLSDMLMPLDYEENGWKLSGWISKPGQGRSTRADMITFVNRRAVDNRLLTYALVESYHAYIPKGRYPVAFLFLELPPDRVDVNVHPAKREVRFREDGFVRRFTMEGLLHALRSVPRPQLPGAVRVEPLVESIQRHGVTDTGMRTPAPVAGLGKAIVVPNLKPELPESFKQVSAAPEAPVVSPPVPQLSWKYLGSPSGNYMIFSSPEGLVILHSRAARERIHFERIRAALYEVEPQPQALLFPAVLELDPMTARALEENLAGLQKMGFEIEPFGRQVYRLRGVPHWFEAEEGEVFLQELIQQLRERGWRPEETDAARTHLARLAARRLARYGRRESHRAPLELVRDLLECKDPLTDSDGRPTYYEIRNADLDRRFGLRQ